MNDYYGCTWEPSTRWRHARPRRYRDLLSTLAARLGVPAETLNDVYTVEGDELKYIVAARRLDTQVRAATRQLALLVAGGRQMAGTEEWTSGDRIRSTPGEGTSGVKRAEFGP